MTYCKLDHIDWKFGIRKISVYCSLPREQFFINSGGKRVRLQLLRHINRHFLRYDMSHRVVCPMR